MRYFIELSYDGNAYHGWQVQTNAVSVQQVLTDCLFNCVRSEEIRITGCGRTDAGVHADQFFAHFDFDTQIDVETSTICSLKILQSKGYFRLRIMYMPDLVHCHALTTIIFISAKIHLFGNTHTELILNWIWKR